jgi:hypothetical protein
MKAVNTKSLVNPRIAFIMKSASLLLLTLLMLFVSACAAFGSTESSSSETPQQGSTSLNPVVLPLEDIVGELPLVKRQRQL